MIMNSEVTERFLTYIAFPTQSDNRISPVRGGTDGSRLSYMGLPCPNLCTGGQNGHGRHEFISCQTMEQTVEILKNLVCLFA